MIKMCQPYLVGFFNITKKKVFLYIVLKDIRHKVNKRGSLSCKIYKEKYVL